jgi:antitoxin FitA
VVMRQLITRIDDRLHQGLRARAAAEGRSVNALVTDLLSSALAAGNERAAVRARAEAARIVVVPHRVRRPPSRDAAIASTKGAGRRASRALAVERAAR